MKRTGLALMLTLLIAGCATTPQIDWSSRIGNYTYDQAVADLGPPDKAAQLSDGSTVADWLMRRGYVYTTANYYPFVTRGYGMPITTTYASQRVPDEFLRLNFNRDGKLTAWKKFTR